MDGIRFADATAAVHTLNSCSDDNFEKGDNQGEDQPDIDHLHVRGGGQFLYLAREDGGHHQHDGQVHSNGIGKKFFFKEDGDKGDEEQEGGGEVGGEKFHGNLPLQLQGHVHRVAVLVLDQDQVYYCEHGQVIIFSGKTFKLGWLLLLVQHPHLRS